MKIYLLLEPENIVRDVITYPHAGYEATGDVTEFPEGFMSGWYRWQDGFVFDQALYDAAQSGEEPEQEPDYEAYYKAVSAEIGGTA